MTQPKWFKELDEVKPTRTKSNKQESHLAKIMKGHTTSNSGAALGQNDVLTDYAEIEAKITGKGSFSIKVSDLAKMEKKCAAEKIPVMVVEFEQQGKSYAVLSLPDLLFFIEQVNSKKA